MISLYITYESNIEAAGIDFTGAGSFIGSTERDLDFECETTIEALDAVSRIEALGLKFSYSAFDEADIDEPSYLA